MKKILISLGILIITTNPVVKAQFLQNNSISLYSDVKAFKTGDAIMVFITEDTKANNSATTQSQRSTTLAANLGVGSNSANSFNPNFSLGTSHNFNAQGSTGRNEDISAKLSAKVIGVEQNGNLTIEGKRTTKINGETQTITIKGTVRPVDVLSDNSVFSFNIMDLTLSIEGDGTVSKTQEPGLITKFLRVLF